MNHDEVLAVFDNGRRSPGGTWEVNDYFVRNTSPEGSLVGIYYSCFPPDKLDEGIKEQIRYFSNLKLDFEWKVYQHDSPANLREKLLEHGFTRDTPEAFLVCDLREADISAESNSVYRIIRAEKHEQLEDYAKVIKAVHHRETRKSLIDRFSRHPEQISIYVAYAGEKPVSTGRIDYDTEHPEFANFSGDATLPEYRRRGIYSSIVRERFREVSARGYPFVYADAMPMSKPILLKLGFQELSTTYPMTWEYRQELSEQLP
jgi:predicted GNAT family acetyltransferase